MGDVTSEIGKTRLSESQKTSLENRAGIKQGEVRSEIMNRLDRIRLSGEM